MKIILRDHVDHLGVRGDVVTVARGYARNFLIPKGLAWEATPGNLKQVTHQRKQWAALEARELEQAQEIADRLSELHLKTTRKAGESGTLYGSVTNADIAEMLAAENVLVDRRKIVIKSPIKALGEYEVGVRLHPKLTGSLKVEVEPEGGRVADTGTTLEEPPETDEDADDDRERKPAAPTAATAEATTEETTETPEA